MQEIATMVDMRFGPGTWKGIVDERARRIQEAKEAAAKARREALQRQSEMFETIQQVALIGTVIVAAIGLFIFLFTVVL